MFSFLILFSSSKNIYISLNGDENSECNEESPCLFDRAFSQLNDSDYLILTDSSFLPNQTDMFLSKLAEAEKEVTVLGNEINIFSENVFVYKESERHKIVQHHVSFSII